VESPGGRAAVVLARLLEADARAAAITVLFG
jgi:hypothetical protein